MYRLFSETDPTADGEECIQDCESCSLRYPAKLSIDEEDELFGKVDRWDTHLNVATGKDDWIRDVADEQGSIMEAVGNGETKPANGVKPFSLRFLRRSTIVEYPTVENDALGLQHASPRRFPNDRRRTLEHGAAASRIHIHRQRDTQTRPRLDQ